MKLNSWVGIYSLAVVGVVTAIGVNTYQKAHQLETDWRVLRLLAPHPVFVQVAGTTITTAKVSTIYHAAQYHMPNDSTGVGVVLPLVIGVAPLLTID